jgi:hypothetical protein
MRIKKFHESSKYVDIEDMLLDFKDNGFEIKTEYVKNLIIIKGKIFQNINRLEFLQDIVDIVKRIESIGYSPIYDELHVYTGVLDGKPLCNFTLRFKDTDIEINKDVKSFDEFKEYVEKILNLNFYEFDTEVLIPDQRAEINLQLDVNKEKNMFLIFFQRGSIDDISLEYQKEISDLVVTNDEWAALNLWSIPDRDKEKYTKKDIVKSAESKVFRFDKKGIEAIEKCIKAVTDSISSRF